MALPFQFVRQSLRIPEVSSVETFGEPVVDFSEPHARLVTAALLGQTCTTNLKTHSGPKSRLHSVGRFATFLSIERQPLLTNPCQGGSDSWSLHG
jgi:hypothetical protein